MSWLLEPHPDLEAPVGPVCLVVMDGVGVAPPHPANAWHLADTPFLDGLMDGPVVGALAAHGRAVGMPTDGDMGNSEVGHNALGAGRVFDQGAKLVANAIASGTLFEGDAWRWVMEPCAASGTLHLLGLWSDGNVHSHLDHAMALLERALADGAVRVRFHLLIDGRDVGETSALEYVLPLERRIAELREAGHDVAVASAGGRMTITMDRYEADWSMVERGWGHHVLGEGRAFSSLSEAIETLRREQPGVIDQNLPGFIIDEGEGPVGTIEDGDAVVLFNFRGDRAIEMTRAFEAPEGADFPFDRQRVPRVRYAGMMQYDGDLQLPSRFLVTPPAIDRTVGEYLARSGKRQVAVSETQKFGHVTYFFNGNRSGAFDETLESYVEIPSDNIDFSQAPAMKAEEIVDATLAEIDRFSPDFVRVNIANGDMVGHTGVLAAAVEAMRVTDRAVERLTREVLERGGICVILADHGNCEEMAERDKKTGELKPGDSPEGFKPATSHTLNPVPCMIVGAGDGERYVLDAQVVEPGLANVTATCLALLGLQPPAEYLPSLVRSGS
ncbi:MAG: phosphoglycerate mutase (2,3-diphosphoglycerate-independent) [Deltaproteobacteria bacterium]|nr:phosphoglycerate mutase (2,3-diphosphoglycerate-independent) [Deltaproteobacteria bacterium]